MTSLSLAQTPQSILTNASAWWFGELPRRASAYAYTIAVGVLAVVTMAALPGTAPSSDPVYALLALAMVVGLLLTVRLAPQRPPAALVLLPAMAMDARFGLAALVAVAYIGIAANLVRGLR